MSMKFWILTINDDENYGNRLQNFALQEILKSYSSNISTVRCNNDDEISVPVFLIKKTLKRFRKILQEQTGTSGKLIKYRRRNFHLFTENFVNDSSLSLSPRYGFSRTIINSDRFIIGSDQVWNDQWISAKILELRLGSLCPIGSAFSYAASFGVDNINTESRGIFVKYLSRLSSISVREDRGADLVRELSGRNATVVLDPTLMLTAEQWRKIMSDNFIPSDERYVLTYFLGKPSDAQEKVIQQYAKEHNCKIRRILDFDDPDTYVAGPREFVELFSKAEYVFTDSYHACCFSILFQKQFKVFNRAGFSGKNNMNSRMQTLFRLFELNDLMNDDTELAHIDYSHVNRLLEQHRAESHEWLDHAMAKIGVTVSR